MKSLFFSNVPVLLVGAPGTGKTAMVLDRFDHCEVMLSSSMVEEDVAGIPYRDGKYDYRTIPASIRRLQEAAENGKTTCLFLDELDKARRSVADTLLTLVASRRCGETLLPESTCIVAACNPPEFGGGDGIGDAMISRFCVIEHVPDVGAWARWAYDRFKSDTSKRVIKRVESGELPLIECTGEGLSRRITSPRTIALALSCVDAGRGDIARVLRGLLTPSAASQIEAEVVDKRDKAMDAATRLRATVSHKKTKPLEL